VESSDTGSELSRRVWREDILKRIQKGLEDFQKRREDIQKKIQEIRQYIQTMETVECVATVVVILVYIWAAFVILYTCVAVLAR
jgi:hypothetical protein